MSANHDSLLIDADVREQWKTAILKGDKDQAKALVNDIGESILEIAWISNREHDVCGYAIHHASIRGHQKLVRYLLRKRPSDVNRVANEKRETPLHWAAQQSQFAIINILLEYEADVDIEDADGCTALYFATFARNVRSVEILLTHGANFSKANSKTNESPLDLAINQRYEDIIQVYLDKRISIMELLHDHRVSRNALRALEEQKQKLETRISELENNNQELIHRQKREIELEHKQEKELMKKELEEKYQQMLETLKRESEEKIEKQRVEIEEDQRQRRERQLKQIEEDNDQRMAKQRRDIEQDWKQRMDGMKQEYQQRLERIEQDYKQRIEIIEQHNEQRLEKQRRDMEQDCQQRMNTIEQDNEQRMERLEQDSKQRLAQQRRDIEQDYEQRLAHQRRDIEQDYEQRLAHQRRDIEHDCAQKMDRRLRDNEDEYAYRPDIREKGLRSQTTIEDKVQCDYQETHSNLEISTQSTVIKAVVSLQLEPSTCHSGPIFASNVTTRPRKRKSLQKTGSRGTVIIVIKKLSIISGMPERFPTNQIGKHNLCFFSNEILYLTRGTH